MICMVSIQFYLCMKDQTASVPTECHSQKQAPFRLPSVDPSTEVKKTVNTRPSLSYLSGKSIFHVFI